MSDALVNVILDAARNASNTTEQTELLSGVVTAVSPLAVTLQGESDMVIPSELLSVGQACRELTVSVVVPGQSTSSADAAHSHPVSGSTSSTNTGQGGDPAHSHSVPSTALTGTAASAAASHAHPIPGQTINVQVWRGLHVGDRVLILRYNRGNAFHILERVS